MRLRVELGVAAAAILLVLGVVLSGCKELPPGIPLEQLNPQQVQGHEVFRAECARCHNDRTTQVLHGPSLYGLYRKPYLPSGAAATDERVTATVTRGRNMMPAMGNKMDSQQMDDLLAYLHTL